MDKKIRFWHEILGLAQFTETGVSEATIAQCRSYNCLNVMLRRSSPTLSVGSFSFSLIKEKLPRLGAGELLGCNEQVGAGECEHAWRLQIGTRQR